MSEPIYYGGGRRRVGRPRKRGRGILSSINDFLKKHRIISTVGNALGSVWAPAGLIGKAAAVAGYGKTRHRRARRRRVYRRRRVAEENVECTRRRGGDLKGVLSKVHKFLN